MNIVKNVVTSSSHAMCAHFEKVCYLASELLPHSSQIGRIARAYPCDALAGLRFFSHTLGALEGKWSFSPNGSLSEIMRTSELYRKVFLGISFLGSFLLYLGKLDGRASILLSGDKAKQLISLGETFSFLCLLPHALLVLGVEELRGFEGSPNRRYKLLCGRLGSGLMRYLSVTHPTKKELKIASDAFDLAFSFWEKYSGSSN